MARKEREQLNGTCKRTYFVNVDCTIGIVIPRTSPSYHYSALIMLIIYTLYVITKILINSRLTLIILFCTVEVIIYQADCDVSVWEKCVYPCNVCTGY